MRVKVPDAPHNIDSLQVSREKTLFFLSSLNARAGFESAIFRLYKQAILTTAPGSPPYRLYSISSGIRSILSPFERHKII